MTYGIIDLAKDAVTGNVDIAPKELSAKRFALCEVCPHFRKNIDGHPDQHARIAGEKCNLCGCYMPVKTQLVKASCPAKKW